MSGSTDERRAEVIERWRKVIDGYERERRYKEANQARIDLHRELRSLDAETGGDGQ